MKSFGIWLMLLLGMVCLENSNMVAGDALSSMEAEALTKPMRPKIFSTADELRNYLDQMSKYYALAGRSRYGKRGLSKNASPKRSFSNNGPAGNIDIYDLIQDK